MKTLVYFITFIISIAVYGQSEGGYKDYLANKEAKSTWFFGTSNFNYSLNEQNYRSDGLRTMIGANLARFFYSDIILGIGVEARGAKGTVKWGTTNDYASAFEAAYVPLSGSADSSKSAELFQAISAGSEKGFRGHYTGSVNFIFSPFPRKYGGFLFQFKMGYRSYTMPGSPNHEYIVNDGSDHYFFDARKTREFGITFKPFTLFPGGKNENVKESLTDWRHYIHLGFTYEVVNFTHSNFYGISLGEIVNAGFMSEYGIQKSYSITLGIGFY